MFWWGNFFSITLHLSGNIKKCMQEKINRLICIIESKMDFFIGINNDQWEHHFDDKQLYSHCSEMNDAEFEEITGRKIIYKAGKKNSS